MSDSQSERGNARLRAIDRYAGIPVVRLLGLRAKREQPPQFSSLGLLQTAAIGDTVLMSAVLSDVRREFPAARIVIFTGSSNHAVAQLLSGVNEIVRLPAGNPLQAIRLVRQHKVEVLCDFGPWPRFNAILAALSGARFLIGFRTPDQYRHYVYDRSVEHSSRRHELENLRALVQALGVESKGMPRLSVSGRLPSELSPGTYIVFHAWSAGYCRRLKEWPAVHWIELAKKASALTGLIVLTGSASDRGATEQLCSKMGNCSTARLMNMAGKTSVAETALVLAKAKAVVSVNTGIAHLAAVVGAPVISINGPVSGARWGPVGAKAISLDAEVSDCGYLSLGFERAGHRTDCMATIQPDRVFRVLAASLSFSSPLAATMDCRVD